MVKIIVAIITFLLVIMIHELGHFLVAKLSGVKVNEFSIGMGPVIKKKKTSETQYTLRALPIGGYVSLEGEDEDSEDSRSFQNAPAYKRLLVILAGAFMNFIFALLIFIVMMSFSTTEIGISSVSKDSPAYTSGLEAGDIIKSINGTEISTDTQVQDIISKSNGTEMTITVDRDNEEKTLQIKPEKTLIKETGEEKYLLGVTMGQTLNGDLSVKDFSLSRGMTLGFKFFENVTKQTFQVFGMLFSGKLGLSNLSVPIGVVNEIGKATTMGFSSVLFMLAFININIGIFNLIPFPALDGGRAVFILIEMITGKAVPKEIEAKIHFVGIILLLLLIVVISFKDITTLNFFGG